MDNSIGVNKKEMMDRLLNKTLLVVKEVEEGVFVMTPNVTIPLLLGNGATIEQIGAKIEVIN
ncbi:hypothetical protein P9597_22785 [Aneurinibacillus migulanus]|uniref:hypothetical protein n=1 Tax=Aneurinibacillus migulanus TaxID=47500 RepID=UPI002E21C0BE|nr:hypothetical protein [Aneurinibacillus migulanus]